MANGKAQRLTGWLLVASLASITGLAQNRSDADKNLPNPYQTIEHYFKMPPGRTLGSSSSVDIDPDGSSVWIADRCAAGSCLGSDSAIYGSQVRPYGLFKYVKK
jgi:hypothetical protein